MLTPRRVLLLASLAVLAAVTYTAWLVVQVRSDLGDTRADAASVRAAFEGGDVATRDRAIADLGATARQAADRTDGWWWAGLTRLPVVGDDAQGARALTRSLATATEGLPHLAEAVDLLDGLTADGRVDVRVLRRLERPVARAHAVFSDAADEVRGLDSRGYVGPVRSRFDEYVDLLDDADRVLGSAETATGVLPGMVGADGPRDFLLVFQNNAEIRATGGTPGSWAVVHADAGRLSMTRQGTGSSFGERPAPVLPLSAAERAVYGEQLGTFFLDAGFTPDFPRAAELMVARWEEESPGTELDGVLSLDPVAMSYLLEGTGPVPVGDLSLTSDNAVEGLLSRVYRELDTTRQDELFRTVARSFFEAATGELPDPVAFVRGVGRAADEGRLLVAPFHPADRRALAGAQVLGALTTDDGPTPHVDIDLNDATGSKMSYYLRYDARVRATGCDGGRQSLTGSMTLHQAITAKEAAGLPAFVTGGGAYGTEPGSQLLQVRIHGPAGGSVEEIRLNGTAVRARPVPLGGRPVVTLVVLLSSADEVVLDWAMRTGPGQTGDPELGLTPGVVPGAPDPVARSAC